MKEILKKLWDKLPKGRPCCVPEAESWIGEKRNNELNNVEQEEIKDKRKIDE